MCFPERYIITAIIQYLSIQMLLIWQLYRRKWGGEGTRIIFLTECVARGPKPLPISKDFSYSKNGWLDSFFFSFRNFCKLRPIYKGFSASKTADFTIFGGIFVKWDPPLRIFLTKMEPMFKDFWWKSNPFRQHIPVCLNMWVPPQDKMCLNLTMIKETEKKIEGKNLFFCASFHQETCM